MAETQATPISSDFEQACEELRMKVFSVVAHDLKTPLACIIGSLGTLDQMRARLSSEQHETLIKVALSEAHRLDDLISEMLAKVKP